MRAVWRTFGCSAQTTSLARISNRAWQAPTGRPSDRQQPRFRDNWQASSGNRERSLPLLLLLQHAQPAIPSQPKNLSYLAPRQPLCRHRCPQLQVRSGETPGESLSSVRSATRESRSREPRRPVAMPGFGGRDHRNGWSPSPESVVAMGWNRDIIIGSEHIRASATRGSTATHRRVPVASWFEHASVG